MTRGIFIVGNVSSLFLAVAAEAAKRVESFAIAPIPSRFLMSDRDPPGASAPRTEIRGAISLHWNPSSPISARTLVLSAESRLTQINDVILICSPPAFFKNAEALTPEEIDIIVNDNIIGWFFMIRELALHFRRTGLGSISFVVPESGTGGKSAEGGNIALDLLGPSAVASFSTLAQGMLASSANSSFLTMGFTGSKTGMEEKFAAWLFQIIDKSSKKDSGKWHGYSRLFK